MRRVITIPGLYGKYEGTANSLGFCLSIKTGNKGQHLVWFCLKVLKR